MLMRSPNLGLFNFSIIATLSGLSFSVVANTGNVENTIITSPMVTGCMLKTDNSSVTVDSSGSISIISNTNRTSQGVGILATGDTTFGKIINHGKIMGAGQSRGIEIEEGATVNAIINTGEITTEGHGIELGFNNSLATVNRGTEEFGIYNSGLIKTSRSIWSDESGIRIHNQSKLDGLFNSGTISGYQHAIFVSDTEGTINNNIVNNGSLSGESLHGIYNIGKIDGIINQNSIAGKMDGVRNEGRIKNINNSGSITGEQTGITNEGTVDSIVNTGTVGSTRYAINNTGTITDSIDNYGRLNGNVELSHATLNLLRNASVSGIINGNSGSAITVGTNVLPTNYTANDHASVGKVSVTSDSVLTLGKEIIWSANGADGITIDGDLLLNEQSTLRGNSTNNNKIFLIGHSANIDGNLMNNRSLILNPHTVSTGNTLNITRNYTGETDSTLFLATVLGDDNSLTDKLIIDGDANGTTTVHITNIKGKGAQTQNGIEIIKINGASNAIFLPGGRIVAGSYDYNLVKKNANWYLTSTDTTEPKINPVEPEINEPIKEPILRPEVGGYLNNITIANTMFNMRLHERLGEMQYTDFLGSKEKITNLWFRSTGGRSLYSDKSGQISTQADRYVFQIGADIAQWSSDGDDRLHLGIMAGHGNNSASALSKVTGYQAKGGIEGYSTGLYTTWYANQQDKSGPYLDSWVLWNWFNNYISGHGLPRENYRSKGITASLETGYSFHIAEVGIHSYWLQPQAQIIWMNVKGNTHYEANGTRITHSGQGDIQLRLGTRVYMRAHHDVTRGQFQPFIEANWFNNSQKQRVSMDGLNNNIVGSKNSGELRIGVEGYTPTGTQIWGSFGQQWGNYNYKDTQVILGIKYSF
ncbi:autotransporter outer membrane beta-barrel domain-containing protein [Candidatus Fukatsuia symbiotica]|nr:autotransporter outer membrane beta-barrel domain-containing protein [Candidatus Fukatsuia symbiotica]